MVHFFVMQMMSYLLVEMQCLLCCTCYRLSGLSANAHKLIYFFNWVPIYLCPQLCVQIYLVDQMMMMHGFDATKWPLAIDIASHIQEDTNELCSLEMQKLCDAFDFEE